jgi:hypothetical protein
MLLSEVMTSAMTAKSKAKRIKSRTRLSFKNGFRIKANICAIVEHIVLATGADSSALRMAIVLFRIALDARC